MQQRLRKCLGIDIGTTSVKIAEMVAEKTGVRVVRLVRGDIPLPPGPLDAARVAEISKLIRELISKNKIATKQAVFCVPGQSVFIRRIRFPRTSEERLHRIVAYEARQQIPFALENSLMEYQVFDYGESAEVEVLLVAIKKDIVLDFMKLVNRAGLRPVMISVTSLALFNFHVFDSTPFAELMEGLAAAQRQESAPKAPENTLAGPGKRKGFSFGKFRFGKKKQLNAEDVANALPPEDMEAPLEIEELPINDMYEEVKAYINVGAQTFDLSIGRYGRHKMLGFTRSVFWAGNELTRALLEKMGLQSPTEAEQIKRERAIAILPGQEEEAQSPGVDANASELVSQWADRMILEIRKSFDYYIAQPDGMAVDNIVLSGGQSQQRNLAPYIEEKLGTPVEVRLSPENGAMTIAPGNENEELTSYLIAMGLGLSGLGLGQVTVDFLPSDLKTLREFKKKNVEMYILLGAIAAMIGLSTQVGQQEIVNMRTWLRTQQPALDEATRSTQALTAARSDRTRLEEKVNALGQGLGDRNFWLEFLGMLQEVKPPAVVIAGINMNSDGVVYLEGETPTGSIGPVSAFTGALAEQNSWIKKVDLTGGPSPIISRINPPQQVEYFTLRLETHWKQTRLAPVRVTLPPGHWTPEPPKATVPGYSPIMGMDGEIPI